MSCVILQSHEVHEWALYLWVCWRMYHEISVKQAPRMAGTSSKSSEPDDGFRNALIKIVLTDLSMSLDNVLTMVGAAEG